MLLETGTTQSELSRLSGVHQPSISQTPRLADLIEGVAGEFSPFEQIHGFCIDGVDLDTSALPDGWHERVVKVQNANTAAPAGEPQFTGWCLDPSRWTNRRSVACSAH